MLKENTKILYIETPSNPLLGITDIKAISGLAKEKGIITMIDNTFASPINQTPSADFGIDVIMIIQQQNTWEVIQTYQQVQLQLQKNI